MSTKKTKDLTTGSPLKLIFGFTIPMLFGYLFQQFYNMVDSIIVGQCLGVSAVLCYFYMKKHFPILKMSEDERGFDKAKAKTLCLMGIPMGLQYSITAIGSVVLQTAVNSLGSLAVAAVSTANRVSLFFCCPYDALGGTMATYAGQNVGAQKLERVREGVKLANLIGFAYAAVAFFVLYMTGDKLALLFMDGSETEIIHQVHQFLVINGAFYCFLTMVNVVRFAIQGMGFSGLAILAGVCEMVMRTIVGFFLVPLFGFLPVCFASGAAWIAADLFLLPAFYHCLRKLKRRFEQESYGEFSYK